MPDITDGGLQGLIEKQLVSSSAWPDLVEVMRLALSLEQDTGDGTVSTLFRFARLPELSCQAAGGDPKWAENLSAAWILFYAAADIMDSVQDDDAPEEWWGDYGPGIALSAASGLYFTASQMLNNLHKNKHIAGAAYEVIRQFYDRFLLMTSGQYRDISLDQPTLEEYWQIVEAKSGAFFTLACWCGARLATDDALTLENFCKYGNHLGVMVQISDELEDVLPPRGKGGVGQRPEFSRSLPVIYAFEVLPQAERIELRENLVLAPDDPVAAERTLEIIDKSGASVYVLAEMERYRIMGTEALEKAAEESPARDALLDILQSI